MDAELQPKNPGHREKHADPNELLIQLQTSAIRLTWSEDERRRRHWMSEFRLQYHDPASVRAPAFSPN